MEVRFHCRMILNGVKREILSIGRALEVDNFQESRRQIRWCLRNIDRIKIYLNPHQCDSLINTLNELALLSESAERNYNINSLDRCYVASRITNGYPGRPKVHITNDQLQLFLREGYTAPQIANQLHCSSSVVYKRMYEEGLKLRYKFAVISDDQLRNEILSLSRDYPNSGSEMMCGLLRAKGLHVQRNKVRKILAETNPVATAIRWGNSIQRRTYSVPTPNSLWHMDAHLKLVRWGFVTHSCIDGYSRLIIYSECATSITAKTVLDIFVPSVKKYGLPSRVRSDHGYENMFVGLLMNCLRGANRGSHIAGRSVHNQRVERLWRDIFCQVLSTFKEEFKSLEERLQLNVDNNIHLFALQYVYLDIINSRLAIFVEAWNRHRIRTAGRKTPRQLWINGILSNMNSNHTAVTGVFNNDAESVNERILRIFGQEQQQAAIQEEVVMSTLTATLDLSPKQREELAIIKNNFDQPVNQYLQTVRFLTENM